MGLTLKVIDFSEEHLKMVKSPRYGYGKAMNPCIDCHLLMLKRAREIMTKDGFDFVATGEVLGERPMSQNQRAMELIEKESGLAGYLLRPLSAKLLKETMPEEKGWIDRKELGDISGRSRQKQLALAEKYGVKDYPSPAGGCLLCELEFSKKLKELLKKCPSAQGNDVEFLKIGRHYWHNNTKTIIGRNHEENLRIEKLARKADILLWLEDIPGPTALIRDYNSRGNQEAAIEKSKQLLKKYSKIAKKKHKPAFKIQEK